MPAPHKSTSEALSRLAQGATLRELEALLGGRFSNGLLWKVLQGQGPVSRRAENELRAALGLKPLPPAPVKAEPCPTCGIVHGAGYDCRGRSVIIRRGRPQPPAWVQQAAEWLAEREACTHGARPSPKIAAQYRKRMG